MMAHLDVCLALGILVSMYPSALASCQGGWWKVVEGPALAVPDLHVFCAQREVFGIQGRLPYR